MKYALFLLSFLLFLSRPALAAYRLSAIGNDVPAKVTASSSRGLMPSKGVLHRLFRRSDNGDYGKRQSIWSNIHGLISFGAGLIDPVMLVLGVFAGTVISTPVVVVVGIASAILAFAAGIAGKRQRPNGFAIAGFWLGLAELCIAVAASLLLLVLLAIL